MNTFKKIMALLLASVMMFGMIACDMGHTPDPKETDAPKTDAQTDAPTDAPTDTPTEVPTEMPTETPTEAPTDPETEAETQPPEPQLLTHVSFDEMTKAGLDITDYLTRPSQTTTAVAQDGNVEAMEHTVLPVISVQWHPETMCFAHKKEDTVDGAKLLSYFARMCSEKR